jgi:hypothetical protein
MKSANGSSQIEKSTEIDFSENIQKLTSARDGFHQVGDGNGEMAADSAGTLVHRLSEAPRREIESLVGRLMTLHRKLQADGDRIQLDIEGYAELNRCVMQLTTIVADSVGKLPAPGIN